MNCICWDTSARPEDPSNQAHCTRCREACARGTSALPQVWGGPLGVPLNAAPYNARAVDAWAMGVLMYLLVTGRYPFEVC